MHPGRQISRIAVFILLGTLSVSACGDKLLLIGRGLRWQSHPASILSYAPPGTPVFALMSDAAFRSAMQKAGHKITVVQDHADFSTALRQEKYNVLLADASEAANLPDIDPASGPVILPVVSAGSEEDIRTAQRQYHCVLKAPSKGGSYSSAVEKALEISVSRKPPRIPAGH